MASSMADRGPTVNPVRAQSWSRFTGSWPMARQIRLSTPGRPRVDRRGDAARKRAVRATPIRRRDRAAQAARRSASVPPAAPARRALLPASPPGRRPRGSAGGSRGPSDCGSSRQREHLAAGLGGEARGDQRARAQRRLDHHGRQRQAGDQAVARGKCWRSPAVPGGCSVTTAPSAAMRSSSAAIAGRIALVRPGAEHGHGARPSPARPGARRCRCLRARPLVTTKPARRRRARTGAALLASAGAGPAAADHRHLRVPEQVRIAGARTAPPADCAACAQQARVVGLVPADQVVAGRRLQPAQVGVDQRAGPARRRRGARRRRAGPAARQRGRARRERRARRRRAHRAARAARRRAAPLRKQDQQGAGVFHRCRTCIAAPEGAAIVQDAVVRAAWRNYCSGVRMLEDVADLRPGECRPSPGRS